MGEPVAAPASIEDDNYKAQSSDSAARQMRKLAAALRHPPRPDAVDVNTASDKILLQQLGCVPKLPSAVAQRIADLRPFTCRMDLVTRVNANVAEKRRRLGPSFLPMLRVDGAHHVRMPS